MAAEELGQRVDDDVGAVLLGPAQIGRGKGVVDNKRQIVFLGDFTDGRNVDHDAAGVGDALAEDRACGGCDRLLEALGIGAVGPFDIPTKLLEGVVELVDRATVELPRGNEAVTRFHQGVEYDHLCRMTRRDSQRRRAAFQCRHATLQHGLRRIADARVDIAEGFQPEQRRGMIDVVKYVTRRLIDRCHPGARRRVRRRTGMNGERRKSGGRGGFRHGAHLQGVSKNRRRARWGPLGNGEGGFCKGLSGVCWAITLQPRPCGCGLRRRPAGSGHDCL